MKMMTNLKMTMLIMSLVNNYGIILDDQFEDDYDCDNSGHSEDGRDGDKSVEIQIDCIIVKMIVMVNFSRYNRFGLYQQQIRDLLAEGAPIDAIGNKVISGNWQWQ